MAVICCNCDNDCTVHHWMCDVDDGEWCPECWEKTACSQGVHGDGCPTQVFSVPDKQATMYLTPVRLACLRRIEAAGGRMGHSDEALAPFCDDASTLTHPDVFNQCHDAGWLLSSHDDRTDESFVRLTNEGKAVLADIDSSSPPTAKEP